MLEYNINDTIWQISEAKCNDDSIYYIRKDYHAMTTCNSLLEAYEIILQESKNNS